MVTTKCGLTVWNHAETSKPETSTVPKAKFSSYIELNPFKKIVNHRYPLTLNEEAAEGKTFGKGLEIFLGVLFALVIVAIVVLVGTGVVQ